MPATPPSPTGHRGLPEPPPGRGYGDQSAGNSAPRRQPPAVEPPPTGRIKWAADQLRRLLRGWDLFRITLWTIFLTLGPPFFLLRGLYFAATFCSALGLFLANMLFTKSGSFATTRGRSALRWVMNLGLLVVGLVSLGLLYKTPGGGWSMVPGTGGWSDVALAFGPGERLALRSPSGGQALGRYADGSWNFVGYPGGNTWSLQRTPSGAVWAAPQDFNEVLVLDPGAREWRHFPRPATGFVRRLHLDAGEVLLVTSQRAYRLQAGSWQPLGPKFATDLCHMGSRWVFVSREGIAEGEDGNQTNLVHSWDASTPMVGCAASGHAYAIDDGFLYGQMRARLPDGSWTERALPTSDVRVLVVNPSAGQEVWLGTWGAGVFRSLDGGLHWENMGLAGFEIRALEVNFEAHQVWAAPANLTVRSGIWERPFNP